jgi:hypothetical protein
MDGKYPLLAWINRWLTKYYPASVPYRYAVMDNSSELVNNREVLQLLEYHEYTPHHTAPESSLQNGPVDIPHQNIATTLRIMLHGIGSYHDTPPPWEVDHKAVQSCHAGTTYGVR